MHSVLRKTLLAMTLAASLAASGHAGAQTYPNRPINIVVAYPAGGDTDALARLFAEKLTARTGQTVVVENRSGAAGMIGSAHVARSAPDGYTLLLAPNTLAITPLVQKSSGVSYDVVKDFTPVMQVATQSLFVVLNKQTGIAKVPDMIAGAKAGSLSSYASPGNGSPMHILGELFNKEAGIKLTQVPYRGSAPAIVDLIANRVPLMYTTLGPITQYIDAGKLVPIAVADAQRSSYMPAIPTLKELGYPNVKVGAWQAILGPKGMPPEIVKTLNEHFNIILKMPEVTARMTAMAAQPEGGEPAKLGALIASDYAMYEKLVKEFNIQAD